MFYEPLAHHILFICGVSQFTASAMQPFIGKSQQSDGANMAYALSLILRVWQQDFGLGADARASSVSAATPAQNGVRSDG